ncbi:hypothetical protein Bca52824_090067 [Brassica carinata]|uniref:thioglucosidase n=1 Tax=Brassica carinata TaxID=52824 RepID=A0A8X7TEZ2_BRACI|nr:hypothetical protein Bca52824_090067 [Brassica carinata]
MKRFGDRVKNWITINQPYTIPTRGYATGTDAPGRCSAWLNQNCYAGDSASEPYIVAHHVLLSHATVVDLYKQKYQLIQGGEIGITMITRWFLPYNNSEENLKAVERAKEFFHGWYVYGSANQGTLSINHEANIERETSRFTAIEALLVKGSYDFIGVNYYMTQFAKAVPPANPNRLSVMTDSQTHLSYINEDGPISRCAFEVLIVIGWPMKSKTIMRELNLYAVIFVSFDQPSSQNGCQVKGYFVWSLGDNYEFCDGYTVRFGLTYIDFANITHLRDLKSSGKWYQEFLKPKENVITKVQDYHSQRFLDDSYTHPQTRDTLTHAARHKCQCPVATINSFLVRGVLDKNTTTLKWILSAKSSFEALDSSQIYKLQEHVVSGSHKQSNGEALWRPRIRRILEWEHEFGSLVENQITSTTVPQKLLTKEYKRQKLGTPEKKQRGLSGTDEGVSVGADLRSFEINLICGGETRRSKSPP